MEENAVLDQLGEHRRGQGVGPLVGNNVKQSAKQEGIGGQRNIGGSHLGYRKHGYSFMIVKKRL